MQGRKEGRGCKVLVRLGFVCAIAGGFMGSYVLWGFAAVCLLGPLAWEYRQR
jgi:hypothetical protein